MAPTYPIPIDHGVATSISNSSWTVVTLDYSFSSPVVIATPSYASTDPPLVARIRNSSGSSFELRVGRADGSATSISGIDVHWIAIEAGVYDSATYGVKMEAATYSSTVTDSDSSWVGQSQSYSNSYTSPVVIGQVMTYADSDWTVFWAMGSSVTAPPDSSNLITGKHVGEDSDTTRLNETIGYIVMESGSGSFGEISFEVGVGADVVQGWDDSPPYTYSHSLSGATTVVLSSAAMDDPNGGWPILHKPSPISSNDFDLVFQEDAQADSELAHTTEQVAYLVLD
ncbi:MAG: hypothetical protein V3T49_05810 [Dehalococcoidia bacterium]